jgi:hypothetical protein
LRKLRAARRRFAVYHPCDLISSLKNHCTPAACSEEPPVFRKVRISAASCAGVALDWGAGRRDLAGLVFMRTAGDWFPQAPKGVIDSAAFTASLKRCPDTNQRLLANCEVVPRRFFLRRSDHSEISVIHPQHRGGDHADRGHRPPDALWLVQHFSEVM